MSEATASEKLTIVLQDQRIAELGRAIVLLANIITRDGSEQGKADAQRIYESLGFLQIRAIAPYSFGDAFREAGK